MDSWGKLDLSSWESQLKTQWKDNWSKPQQDRCAYVLTRRFQVVISRAEVSLLWILLKHVLHICPIKTVFQLKLHRWKISWTLVFYNFKRLWHSASKEAFVIFGYIFAILPPSQPDWCCTQIFWKKFMVQIDLFPPSRYPLGWSCEFTQRNGLILVYHRSILCCDLKFNPSCQFMW